MNTGKHCFTAVLLLLAQLPLIPAAAALEAEDYLFTEIALPVSAVDLYNNFMNAYIQGEYQQADTRINDLLQQSPGGFVLPLATQARLLCNAAVVQTQLAYATNDASYTQQALAQLQQATDLLSAEDPFHPDLSKVFLVTALVQELQQAFPDAIESLRRAQHITHRHDGVYSQQQLPIIGRLAVLDNQMGDYASADREYMFELSVGERVYGANGLEQVPALIRAGNHFAMRASVQPFMQPNTYANLSPNEMRNVRPALFRTAFELYDNAVSILETHYGPDDLRLIKPLKEMAYARVMQGTAQKYAEATQERILQIVMTSPGTDVPDQARALVEMGDVYTITGNPDAAEHYLRAWQMLKADAQLAVLQAELFAGDTRLYPLGRPAHLLSKAPYQANAGEELFVDLAYEISAEGRANSVVIVAGNIPNAYKRDLQSWFQMARFRPRIEDGAFVERQDMTYHQVYKVAGITTQVAAASDDIESKGEAETHIEPDAEDAIESGASSS